MMTSREIIDRVVHFGGPERIGMTLPEPYPRDMAHSGPGFHPDFKQKRWSEGDTEYWTDEWGCTWFRLGGISKGEVHQGAITEWDQLDDYRVPDFGDDRRYDGARKTAAQHPEKYLVMGLPGGWVFAAARYIRKMELYLADLLLEPQRVEQLHDIVVAENEKVIRKAAELGYQGVMVAEDWGTQTQPLVSPKMFNEIFKPRISHLCGLAKSLGLTRWMHSCGAMTKLIPDLIDAGVQVFQFDQPTLHGIDYLNEQFGGKASFWCPIDIQKTLQTKNPELIRAEARKMIETLGGHRGGFIGGYYGDNVAIGLDPSVQDIACKAFVEFGNY